MGLNLIKLWATAAAALGPKKDLAETAGGKKVIKLAMDRMGWHILTFLDFEMEIYPESKIGRPRAGCCQRVFLPSKCQRVFLPSAVSLLGV